MPSPEHPFDAYHGLEPFIFVSYSHRDGAEVFPELMRLHRAGYRIWYDEGIDPGNEWTDEIARALERSAYFIVFVSDRAVQSTNVRNEINFALNHHKPFLAIHLAEVELSRGLELRMADIQAVFKYQLTDEKYRRKIERSLPASTLELDEGKRAKTPLVHPTPSIKSASNRARLIAGCLAFGLFVAGVIGYLATTGRHEVAVNNVASPSNQKQPVTTPAIVPVVTAKIPGLSKTNGQGIKFVSAGTDGVLFSVWDVRVRDFADFVDEEGYNATGGMYSLKGGAFGQFGATWKNPGFSQTNDDPIVGVSWNDALAYCAWLTKKEQADGLLAPNQSYRLPKDSEWSQAVGLNEDRAGSPVSKDSKIAGIYPWGKEWPPPHGGGNYAGSEARMGSWPSDWGTIAGYEDGFPRTSPVGSFKANVYGLYDMGGDVWQWCADKYDDRFVGRVLRGGSWVRCEPAELASSFRHGADPDYRGDGCGFRIVMVAPR